MRRSPSPPLRGFTLIELLVVIAIIGLLATLATIAAYQARTKALDARVRGDLSQMREAMGLLETATNKWPNGCPPWQNSNPEVVLSDSQAGIASAPVVGDQGDGCEWTAEDLVRWDGPYATTVTDPWGNPYQFDADYYPYQNCPTKTTEPKAAVVLSYGPNGEGPNAYDCDDIFLKLK